MHKISSYSTIFIEYLSKIMLVLLVLIVSWVVFGRYVLGSTPAWGEESARLLMVWIALTSASTAIRNDTHLKLAIVDLFLPKSVLTILNWIILVLLGIFSLFFIIAGIELVQLTSTNILTGLRISSMWLYLAVPVSGFAMLIQILDKGRKML